MVKKHIKSNPSLLSTFFSKMKKKSEGFATSLSNSVQECCFIMKGAEPGGAG